jgi:protein-tyrosine phosphatase
MGSFVFNYNLRGKHPEQQWYVDEKNAADRHNVVMFDIPTSADTLTSKKNLLAILDVFDHAPRPMLVHCRAGVDRTGEVSALWAMDQQGKSNAEALNELSLWHRHSEFLHPAKKFLITIWRGREWLHNEYDPKNYPQFKS